MAESVKRKSSELDSSNLFNDVDDAADGDGTDDNHKYHNDSSRGVKTKKMEVRSAMDVVGVEFGNESEEHNELGLEVETKMIEEVEKKKKKLEQLVEEKQRKLKQMLKAASMMKKCKEQLYDFNIEGDNNKNSDDKNPKNNNKNSNNNNNIFGMNIRVEKEIIKLCEHGSFAFLDTITDTLTTNLTNRKLPSLQFYCKYVAFILKQPDEKYPNISNSNFPIDVKIKLLSAISTIPMYLEKKGGQGNLILRDEFRSTFLSSNDEPSPAAKKDMTKEEIENFQLNTGKIHASLIKYICSNLLISNSAGIEDANINTNTGATNMPSECGNSGGKGRKKAASKIISRNGSQKEDQSQSITTQRVVEDEQFKSHLYQISQILIDYFSALIKIDAKCLGFSMVKFLFEEMQIIEIIKEITLTMVSLINDDYNDFGESKSHAMGTVKAIQLNNLLAVFGKYCSENFYEINKQLDEYLYRGYEKILRTKDKAAWIQGIIDPHTNIRRQICIKILNSKYSSAIVPDMHKLNNNSNLSMSNNNNNNSNHNNILTSIAYNFALIPINTKSSLVRNIRANNQCKDVHGYVNQSQREVSDFIDIMNDLKNLYTFDNFYILAVLLNLLANDHVVKRPYYTAAEKQQKGKTVIESDHVNQFFKQIITYAISNTSQVCRMDADDEEILKQLLSNMLMLCS